MLEERIKEWEKELIEKGLKEGIEKGEAEVLLRQLERKFGAIPSQYCRRIDEADSAQILAWAERILAAESIDDVFGE